MNACSFCRNGKRKCNKARPACSNCVRLNRTCVYTEDAIQTHFSADPAMSQPPYELIGLNVAKSLPGIEPFSRETIQRATVDISMRILGSFDNILATSNEFFVSTHQRIPVLSRFRFRKNLETLATGPKADFALLCLCILLIQQMPLKEMKNVQSPLYLTVKDLISVLEATNDISLDLVICRFIVAFYEMGHGLQTAAYVSIAACARTARALGLNKKPWLNFDVESDKLTLEEAKRAWWAIVIMDRFIGLCNGDALFATDDPETSDSIPVSDLIWSEASSPADIENLVDTAPTLGTPANVTVGQMARECQISFIVGRVVRHLFDPTPDPEFHSEEAVQLERTMNAYLPLLADEELRIGKYCAGFGVCNSALFILYEFQLRKMPENSVERQRILKSMEETSMRAYVFAESAYGDREENYPHEILSPYLPYSLCQAAIVQYRIWRQNNDPAYKQRLDKLKAMMRDFANRWMVAAKYSEIIENLTGDWPPLAIPHQGSFTSTEKLIS